MISAVGGKGGTPGYTYYKGVGGDGGDGWIRLDDGSGYPSLSGTTVDPSSFGTGSFSATGAGAPSIAQTLWINMGVFDPVFEDLAESDLTAEIAKAGQTIGIEVQAAPEDVFDLGEPDEDLASGWVDIENITSLNGYSYGFIRLRITFVLADDQEIDDPMPFVDRIRLPFNY